MAVIITNHQIFLIRAGRGGRDDLQQRVPELRPLSSKTIAIFGLGCLGAPSALEFARAGIGELRLFEPDYVDPGTIPRWPIGMSAVGLRKIDVIAETVERDYPYTKVRKSGAWRIGSARAPNTGRMTEDDEIGKILDGASLVYDATVEFGVHHYLSEECRVRGIPYVVIEGTQGGWGGSVCRIQHSTDGCWLCYMTARDRRSIPPPPSAPNATGKTQPPGCANPTFTGASFDLVEVALWGVRMAVSTLCAEVAGAYPSIDWDFITITTRESATHFSPKIVGSRLVKHPECERCSTI